MKWFKHDSRANRDAKIEKLMLRYGADGYALYWLCLELITDRIEADCLTFELEHDAETLGLRLKIDSLRVEEIMRWLVKEGLFEVQEDHRITCLKLAKRLDNSLLRSPDLLKIQGKIRNGNTTFIPNDSESSGTVPNDSCQIRREEKRREKKEEREGVPASPPAPASPDFSETKKLGKPAKHRHGTFENVLLTEDERSRLSADFPNALEAIDFLSTYLKTTGKAYKEHNLVLRNWVFDAIREKAIKAAELESRAARVQVGETVKSPARQAAAVPEFWSEPAAEIDDSEFENMTPKRSTT